MNRTTVTRFFPSILLVLFAQAACASDALNFFNNWFVTGDYAVAGVGLRGTGVNGWASGTINMTGVPAGAQPIAAFLYWSTIETTSAPGAVNGYFNGNEIQGVVLGNPQNPNKACFSSGGTTNSANGLVYRADVLRYLPVDSNNVRQANGQQTVKFPDSGGNGNGNIVFTDGASLVVIYTVVTPGSPLATPLRAVVIYNGAYTLNSSSAPMTQNVAGFYQASANAAAKVTNIVANGQSGFSTSLSIQSQTPLLANTQTPDSNPFLGGDGTRWDDHTDTFSLPTDASFFSALATVGTNQTCVTWAAIVASMAVKDTDADGLLDKWETNGLHRNTQVSPATFGGCSDYPSDPCVNLPLMGANPNTQDIFLQLDWMHGVGDGTGGSDGRGTHDHMPQLAALNSVAAAFAAHGVNIHFDVGNNYQGPQSICGNAACSFIVPASYAQGGSDIDESTLVCQNTASHTCNYNVPYPVISFEYGFASVRDGNSLLNINPHFAQNRKDIFHYALFAHTLAGPFDANGNPIDPTTGQPTTVPRSYSGIAHRPGGGLMVTFGLWRSDIPANDQVGSAQAQAGTIMHELGHNLALGHAGLASTPNCMPNYPSIMNYLYQTRGLTDAAGVEHIDYSNGTLTGLNESSLSLSSLGLSTPYRIRFYGPMSPNTPPGAAAQLHCDGTPITDGAQETRLESPSVGTPDWSNGTLNPGSVFPPFDINFDGVVGESFTDQPDWTSLNLQQIGNGYSFGGLSVGGFGSNGGVFATDGRLGSTDAGVLATQGAAFTTNGGAWATDGGAWATDGGVWFLGTSGGVFATDGRAGEVDAGDLDYSTVILSSIDPPPPSSPACPTCGLVASNTISSIASSWTPPDLGNNLTYNLYRCVVIAPAASCTPSGTAFKNISGGAAGLGYVDAVNDFVDSGATCPTGATCYNTPYVYAVTSLALVNSSQIESGFSNTATGIVEHLFITANNKSRLYGAPNPPLDYAYSGLDVTTLPAGSVTCTTTATQSSSPGTYPITCGPSPATTSSAIDGITYIAGTLTITKATATIVVTPYSVTYDGNAHTATGKATGMYGEDLSASLNLSGTTHTNAGAYSSDPWTFSGGANYNDASGTVSDNIAKATATIVVTGYNVTYDTTAHTASGTATGVGGANLNASLNLSGTTHTNAGTYSNDPWSFSGGTNYYNASGTVNDSIAQATAAISVTAYNLIYDGNAHTATGTATGIGGTNLIADLNLSGTTHTNVGTYNNDPWSFTDPNGNYKPASGTVNDAILWKFTGLPLKSPAKMGSSVPINWTLQDASGNYITSMSTLVKLEGVFNGAAPSSGCVASLSGVYKTLYSLPNGATGNSSFRYSSSFTFNWDTGTVTATGPGCYTVKITLNDGTARMTNAVQLK